MLRARMKDMDLRITELADYLQISRPTMYKFIEFYDNGNYELINKKVLKLFNYITEHELAGKSNVIQYILSNLVEMKELENNKELEIVKKFKKLIINNPDSKKSQFLSVAVTSNKFDDILYFIMEINSYLQQDNLSPAQEEKLKLYTEFMDTITKLNTKEE